MRLAVVAGVTHADLPPPEHVLGHLIANRYLVETLCDSSSTSAYYRADDLSLDRAVLVRILPAQRGIEGDACRRALECAERVSALPSPHLSRTLDVGLLGEHWPFSICEYSKGQTLARVLAEGGALPLARVLSLGRQAASALEAAHAAGFAHGSLDLDSLWLESLESRPEWLRVMGFGLAELPPREFDGPASGVFTTSVRGLAGAPMRSSAAMRADIHALGISLYHLATGSRPAWIGNQVAAILDSDFVAAGWSASRALRRGLAMILQRCLYLLPDTNYESMAQLGGDLAQLAQTLTTLSGPASGRQAPVTAIHSPAPRALGLLRGEPKVIVRGG